MAQGYKLVWKGAEARDRVVRAVIAGLHEFHLEVEREAKAILQPGAGVITGTLRRSIHADSPSYNWEGDDEPPSKTSTNRGKSGGLPEEEGDIITGTIGSGLTYAMPIHGLYQYITRAHGKESHKLLGKLEKHAKQQGLI